MSQSRITHLKVIAVSLFLCLAGINLLYLPATNLTPNETYYWQWSRHLAPGYFDQSPLVAYLIRFFTVIGGSNEFAIRLPAWLTWTFLNLFLFKFTHILYHDEQTAYWALMMGLLNPFFLTAGTITSPDLLLLLFSLPVWILLYKAIEAESSPAWYGAGLFLGLALLAKVEALIIPLSVLALLVFRPSKWKLLAQKEPYLGALISIICFSPVLYWNWQHNWVTIVGRFHYAFHPLINWGHLREWFILQISVFSLLLAALLYYTLKRLVLFYKTNTTDYFLIGCFLPSLLFSAYTGLTNPAHSTWIAAAYIPAIIFLAGQFSLAFKYSRGLSRPIAIGFILIAFVLSGLSIALLRYPGLFSAHPGLRLPSGLTAFVSNDSSYGWSALGTKVERLLRQEFPHTRQPVPIFADSAALASELAYYVKRPIAVYTTRQALRSQFDYWTVTNIRKDNRQPGLLILERPRPDNTAWYFKETTLVDLVSIRRFNRLIRTVYIYRFQQLDAPALQKMATEKPLNYPGLYPE